MSKARKVLILPDLHEESGADTICKSIVLKVAEYLKPDEIVSLGDWADCTAASGHPATVLEDMEPESLWTEFDSVNAYIDALRKASGGCEWVYVEGNHEQWIERQACKIGGQLGADMFRAMSPKHAIADGRKGFKWIPYAKAGLSYYQIAEDLIAVHGWSASKHAAAAHLAKAINVSVVYGHTHRQDSFTTRIPTGADAGRVVTAWTPGCLCKFQPTYMHRSGPSTWAHGFSIVYVGRSGDWTHYTITIKPGGFCVLPSGKQVRV